MEELAVKHDITVVAPDREQSGVGTSVSLHRILRVRSLETPAPARVAYSVEGTPADCVILGLGSLCPQAEMVIAGINEGANLGNDVFISGTVGAALQAHFRGVPSMAVSVADLGSVHYKTAARVAATLVDSLQARGLPTEYLVNVNVPDLPPSEIRGVVVTRQARRRYADKVRQERDTRGKEYYWIVRGKAEWDVEPGTDLWAIANGYVSLLPVHALVHSEKGAREMEELCQPLLDALHAGYVERPGSKS